MVNRMVTIIIYYFATGQQTSSRILAYIKYTNWFNNKYIYFSVKSKALISMDNFSSNFAQFMPEAKSSLLSLQLLDEVAEKPEECTQNINERISYQYDNQYSRVANYNQHSYPAYPEIQALSEKNDTSSNNYQQLAISNIQPRNLFDAQSEISHETQLKKAPSQVDHSQIQILKNLGQSDISGQTSRDAMSSDHNPQSQLALLKELQQKAMATFDKTQYAESVKQNFEVLFQKVYGIIQEIQQRNQKSQISKSNLKLSHKKELTINPRVVQLSMGKENEGGKRKKYCNIQTELDYNQSYEDEYIRNYLKTEECIPVRTPCSSASKMMISSTNHMLSLSKQLPYIVSSRSYVANTARSEKSCKMKGITLVSAQKKYQKDEKKPVKITLMQKKIVLEGKKNTQPRVPTKTDKKTSAFNANNFFNSRRVSTTRII